MKTFLNWFEKKTVFFLDPHKDIFFQDPNVEELALELLEHTCVIGNYGLIERKEERNQILMRNHRHNRHWTYVGHGGPFIMTGPGLRT